MNALTTGTKRGLRYRTKQIPRVIVAAAHLLLTTYLCSCLPERFRHEKYDCSASLAGINTIILNKAKPGDHAKITVAGSEIMANITQITDQTAWVTYKNIQMKINRKTGVIIVVEGTRYQKIICKQTIFTM